jgi:hypothetical protein
METLKILKYQNGEEFNMKDDVFQKFQDFIIVQSLSEMFSFFDMFYFWCCINIKTMLPSEKIIMAANYMNIKKGFRRHLGMSHHFDFLAWQHCFYIYIAPEVQHIKK